MAIHGQSLDGQSYHGVCGYFDRAVSPEQRWPSIDDPWMAKVTMVYVDTLTELLALSIDGHT